MNEPGSTDARSLGMARDRLQNTPDEGSERRQAPELDRARGSTVSPGAEESQNTELKVVVRLEGQLPVVEGKL